jgi:hypothetical protein
VKDDKLMKKREKVGNKMKWIKNRICADRGARKRVNW